ncbi:hypothetical protein COTS27_01685 [Spirochaetota bacterium]|nr:hypothetical protein COTS27_01685 [Spirochaetota bacterium]
MKTLLTLICLMTMLYMPVYGGDAFCRGYEKGYAAGACYGDYYCLAPIPPICPIPDIGERSYIDGYNRGFVEGLYSE